MESYAFRPIGRIHSCYTEKFGIPRQSGLVPDAPAMLEILSPFDQSEAFRGLEGFSHLWLLFVFHACWGLPWRATVRPPRLGGNQRMGVFATRSGFRPNPIGQSVLRLAAIERAHGVLRLHLKGADLLDGTPILDIKPYVPYADSIPEARAGYAQAAPCPELEIHFCPDAEAMCQTLEPNYPGLKGLIAATLVQDPRPAYCKSDQQPKRFGMRLWNLNIVFSVQRKTITVESITSVGR